MSTLQRRNNPTRAYIEQWVAMGEGKVVRKYNVCLSDLVCYTVYEPSSVFGPHSTITFDYGHQCFGDLTTRRLPPELDALPPRTDKRSQAVRAYQQARQEEAEALIHLAFPDDFAQEVQA